MAQEKVHWDVVSKIREESFERSKVMDYVWHLTDVIGPRLAGSTSMGKAQQWTKTKMDEMGLASTALEPWGQSSVSWEQKYTSIHLLEPAYQPIIGYPVAFSPGTNGKITGTPVIVDIQTNEDLEKYRGQLTNAIVLAHPEMQIDPRYTADAVRHDEESLAAYAATGTNINFQRRQKESWWKLTPPKDIKAEDLEKFFKSENVAVVLNPGRGGDGTVRVGGRRSFRNDMSAENIDKGVSALVLTPEHYNRLYRLAKNEIPVKMEIEINIEIAQTPTDLVNVVGEIPGGDLAHELVMIGGHLDSWHTATGASDNAAGASVALEAMRILKAIGASPRRTIRIALWESEEMGHRGSIGYVAKHFGNPRDGKKPGYDDFSVYFNVDNGGGQFRGVHLQGNEVVAPIFAAWLKPFHDLDVKTLSKFSNTGSDQVRFDNAGLPGFQFLQDRIDYWTRRWHYNMDFYDHVVQKDLKTNAAILASFAYHAAMRDEKIPRKIFKNWDPSFEPTQEELFSAGNALTNAVADYDNDGDLDLFIGFRDRPNRLYRNDSGRFTDVADKVGIADPDLTRAAAWGDYNGDGHLDLVVGFVARSGSKNILYKNDGNGKHFTDVTQTAGVRLNGSFRQMSWIDYDNDGDVDLFVALRDQPNVLFKNDNGKFTNVAETLGVGDSRRTVGAAWFDFDQDGDLDLYVTNMDGDANGMFRNDGSGFVDVAKELGLDSGGRPLGMSSHGSVRPSLADFDNDGDIDIFLANYGPNGLFKNENGAEFINVGPKMGLAIDGRYDTGTWGDYNHDGLLDLYVNGTISNNQNYRDYLFQNDGERFIDVTPKNLGEQQADHGAQWADCDNDGDLDLALTGAGMHTIFQNLLAEDKARRSLQIMVLDARGRYTLAGSEVRVYETSSKKLLGMRILDTGSGYNSQNAMPVHFGLLNEGAVDVEVTMLTKNGRKTALMTGVAPREHTGRWLVIKVDREGNLVK
jgi:hypothetical protein